MQGPRRGRLSPTPPQQIDHGARCASCWAGCHGGGCHGGVSSREGWLVLRGRAPAGVAAFSGSEVFRTVNVVVAVLVTV
jgi:hypothetical protein